LSSIHFNLQQTTGSNFKLVFFNFKTAQFSPTEDHTVLKHQMIIHSRRHRNFINLPLLKKVLLTQMHTTVSLLQQQHSIKVCD